MTLHLPVDQNSSIIQGIRIQVHSQESTFLGLLFQGWQSCSPQQYGWLTEYRDSETTTNTHQGSQVNSSIIFLILGVL